MNKIYRVIWSKTKNCYVVVSEYAKRNGKCSSRLNKKLIAAFLAAGTVLSVTVSAWAGSPQLAPDQSAVSNDSGLEVYTVPGTTHQYTGDNAGIDIQLTQNAANGANVVVAGVSNMGTYTEGGKILLYQVESGSTGLGKVYYGEIETVEGIYKYTAVEKDGILYTNKAKARAAGVDVDSLSSQGYDVGVKKPSGGTISTAIQSASKPTSVTFGVRTQKKEDGYFQTQTITKKISGTMNATAEREVTSEAVVQVGDVVTASVSKKDRDQEDYLTISVNGEETEFVDDYVKAGYLTTKATDDSNKTVTTFENTDGTTFTVDGENTYVASGEVTTEATDTSDKVVTTFTRNYGTTFDVESKNTYVAKAEVVQEATDESADVKVKLTRNDGKSFDLDLKDRYVAKAEVTQAATDESDEVKVQLTRNDGESFNLDLNNTYVAKAEVTKQATDASDDVTIELTRNDGKSFELATKNTYLASAELNDHTLTLGRNDGTEFEVKDLAILDDGMTYEGDNGSATVKLNNTVSITGGATELTDGNIGVVASQDGDSAKLEIKLAKDIKDVDSIEVNKTITVGGDTTINSDGMTIKDGPSVTKDGIDAGSKKITNVAPGTADTDAVNVSQLKEASGDIYNEINRLDNSTRKGIAGAAALAALHPMDFNPDDKMQFSAGVGHYRGETAAALGMFYRPDESVMLSLGGTFGNSDNIVNAGITFGLDGTRNRITRSRTAMAHEIVELKDHIARQDEQIAKLTELVNKLVGPEQQIENTVMFPDVPENHWAYQYVEDLQKQGIIEGYPDGLFKGGRSMTRYEFAAMLDRALLNGAKLDAKISKEFAAELSRIYVERISGQDNDRKKVERVRVNNSDSKNPEGKTRDVYGSKIVTEIPKKPEAK